MSPLLTPIELQRPALIHFGSGLATEVGSFARRSSDFSTTTRAR
jgi:hypothetical protein